MALELGDHIVHDLAGAAADRVEPGVSAQGLETSSPTRARDAGFNRRYLVRSSVSSGVSAAGVPFFQTRMGQLFFEVTLPKVADELACLNRTLEPIAAALQALSHPPNAARGSAGADEASLQAVLVQLARGNLPSDALDAQMDALGLAETIATALGIALRAACQAGVAATLRELRADSRDDAATPQ